MVRIRSFRPGPAADKTSSGRRPAPATCGGRRSRGSYHGAGAEVLADALLADLLPPTGADDDTALVIVPL
ncbi:hypothetical protein ACFYXM_36900 [Streptomyces sp. NPDC002476]|uniref:hypothetical protein n=1 Tax=Streptomyces sp. NPDC002476 TaxID=3364648 RepID=UPI00368E8DD5